MQEYKISVLPEDAGKRLDLFLIEFFKKHNLAFSRTFIQKLIQKESIGLNGRNAAKPHYKIKADDKIKIEIADKNPAGPAAENIHLEVLYEDEDLAIINKPTGLVVHPAPGNYEHTLVNALLYRFTQLSDINPQRPGIVHRLDKETSGILVIAKNNFTHLALAGQFADHTIKRRYVALVKGQMEFDENIIELPIGRHPYKRKNMAVGFGKNTRYAKTYYRTMKRSRDCSLLELEPFTGRTHQLRVHLAFLGHPILGDTKYGRNNEFTPLQTKSGQNKDRVSVTGFSRMALHARSLGFIHPRTGKFMEFSSDIPSDFMEVMNE